MVDPVSKRPKDSVLTPNISFSQQPRSTARPLLGSPASSPVRQTLNNFQKSPPKSSAVSPRYLLRILIFYFTLSVTLVFRSCNEGMSYVEL